MAGHYQRSRMTTQNRPINQINRREFISGVSASALALNAGTLTFGFAGPARGEPAGPREVRDIENVWIPMSDGVKLAARLWLPEDAEQNPVPAILEYIPYRKRDMTRLRDETMHPYFAANGYASIRVDIRGSGDSEGLQGGEYDRQEQADGMEIIAWLARQPWCTGKVGMFGKSWGGFNSLQLAARRPPALKAIITLCSTDDRYTDDAHYKGGTIIQAMNLWGSQFFTLQGGAPDPEIVGERWREMWLARLRRLDFHLADWVRRQHRDEFWKHGSVNENYGDIECPVYAIGGWVDCYSNAVPRLLAGLKTPRKGLIGPWGHVYPHQESAEPGPRIDYLGEALRWWDYWLKGIDTGIMDEPVLRVWMQHEPACCGAVEVNGRWVAEESWPSPRIRPRTYHLNASGLDTGRGGEQPMKLAPLQTDGQTAPRWGMFNMQTDLPVDQRIDDARSMSFDSEPLEEDFEILGAPVVTVEVAVDKPVAFLAVRLNEVFPDRVSKRVTYTVLNLTHRDSHETPTPLTPGKRYRIPIQLDDIAHRFTRGNRLRVAISTTYWPHVWPSPEPVNLTLYSGVSTLELPVRPERPEDGQLRAFGPAFEPAHSGLTIVDAGGKEDTGKVSGSRLAGANMSGRKDFIRQIGGSKLTLLNESPETRFRLNATGTVISTAQREQVEVDDLDPTSAKVEIRRMYGYARGDAWNTRVETTIRLVFTKDEFLLTSELRALEHDEVVFENSWNEKIPRLLV